MGGDSDGRTGKDHVLADYECRYTRSRAENWGPVSLIDDRGHDTSITGICVCWIDKVQRMKDVSIRSYGGKGSGRYPGIRRIPIGPSQVHQADANLISFGGRKE